MLQGIVLEHVKVCAVEYRKRDGIESQITIGCKQEQACRTQHAMNFNDPHPNQKQVTV